MHDRLEAGRRRRTGLSTILGPAQFEPYTWPSWVNRFPGNGKRTGPHRTENLVQHPNASEQSTHRQLIVAARAGAADRISASHQVVPALTKLRNGAVLDVGERQDLLREHERLLEQVAALESHHCPATDITALAHEIVTWCRRELPATDANTRQLLAGMKVAEEAGELVGALCKRTQGVRGVTSADVLDELGDVLIAALSAAVDFGCDPAQVLNQRWATVSQRRFATAPTD